MRASWRASLSPLRIPGESLLLLRPCGRPCPGQGHELSAAPGPARQRAAGAVRLGARRDSAVKAPSRRLWPPYAAPDDSDLSSPPAPRPPSPKLSLHSPLPPLRWWRGGKARASLLSHCWRGRNPLTRPPTPRPRASSTRTAPKDVLAAASQSHTPRRRRGDAARNRRRANKGTGLSKIWGLMLASPVAAASATVCDHSGLEVSRAVLEAAIGFARCVLR